MGRRRAGFPSCHEPHVARDSSGVSYLACAQGTNPRLCEVSDRDDILVNQGGCGGCMGPMNLECLRPLS